ncbi:MAG: hypothetical protein O2819_07095 [Planctomycetota bacterium]|nr:hypothetical protein [Planctomycetota bacterium]MDA1106051.1 hypothetical protein [Planctomycetota bacterium]
MTAPQHQTPNVLLFDDGLSDFGPLSATRLAFEHRAGALCQIERVGAMGASISAGAATTDLWSLHAGRVTERWGTTLARAGTGPTHAIHGLASPTQCAAVLSLPEGNQLVDGAGRLVGAALGGGLRIETLAGNEWRCDRSAPTQSTSELLPVHPWHLLDQLPSRLAADIELLSRVPGATRETTPLGTIVRHGSVTIEPGAVLDARKGPIVLWDNAVIGANAVIQGPCVVGSGSSVSPRGLVKPNTVIGPTCRVGCEIGGSIIYGFSNAVHDGHIGDSIVGEWVNIGAGSCVSNLLNTYGEVVASLGPSKPRFQTGRTHYGGVCGDHAKIAILVAIPTGFSIDVGAMVATTRSPQTVGPFGWVTPERSSVNRLSRFLETEEAMMARRQMKLGPAMRSFLESLHTRTAHAAAANG